MSEEGKKWDTGKTRYDLLDPEWLEGVAEILTHGADKYGDNNWQAVEEQRYVAALMRHWVAFLQGESRDPESGMHHLYHVVTNAFFLEYKDRTKT